ncbi:MAG: hypothetical protein ACKO34_00700 [Vampirovibrionales bacterium]
MLERFNRRLSEAIRRYPITHKHRNRFNCKEDRVAYIEDFVYTYNRTRLKCIGYKAPLEHLCNHAKQYTSGRGGRSEALTRCFIAWPNGLRKK